MAFHWARSRRRRHHPDCARPTPTRARSNEQVRLPLSHACQRDVSRGNHNLNGPTRAPPPRGRDRNRGRDRPGYPRRRPGGSHRRCGVTTLRRRCAGGRAARTNCARPVRSPGADTRCVRVFAAGRSCQSSRRSPHFDRTTAFPCRDTAGDHALVSPQRRSRRPWSPPTSIR